MMDDLLLVRSGGRLFALPVAGVEETMRPLPIDPVPEAPSFVRGTAIVRGKPIPVVDLAALFGDEEGGVPTRLVTLKTGGTRRVGLLVDEVLGIRERHLLSREELPPLLQDAAADVVQELGRLDDSLLTVLRTGNLIHDDVWAKLSDDEVSG